MTDAYHDLLAAAEAVIQMLYDRLPGERRRYDEWPALEEAIERVKAGMDVAEEDEKVDSQWCEDIPYNPGKEKS